MASPFRIFRKHQKAMFAVLGVMVMIAFVFLPGTATMSGRGGGQSNPVWVHTTKFGDLRGSEVSALLSQRQQLLSFLAMLEMDARQAGDKEGKVQFIQRLLGPAAEASVVDKWLLARQAEAMGIVVDDKAINSFLQQITNNRVSSDKMVAALKTQKSSLSEPQLFAILREELLALRVRYLCHQLGAPFNQPSWLSFSIPPGQRWEYFKRLKQQATVELAQVPVKAYVAKVPDPSETELKQFFDEHKELAEIPDSPEPGFRQPRKVSLQYLRADEAKFIAAVTPEDIKQEYEKNKDKYDKLEKELEKAAKTEEKRAPADEKAAKKEDKKAPVDEKVAKKEEKKAPVDEKAVKKEEKKDASAPAKDAPKPKDKDAEKAKEPAKPAAEPKSEKTSTVRSPSPFRLVSYADEKAGDAKKPTDEKKQADEKKPADVKKPAVEKKPADKKPADVKKPADEKKPVDEKKPADAKKPADEKKPTVKTETTPAASTKPKEKEIPSAQVKDRIRETLARKNMLATMAKLQELLSAYRVQWTRYDAELKRNPDAVMPASPDFNELAQQNGLTAAKTGSVAQLDLWHVELGTAYTLSHEAGMQRRVAQAAFESRRYQPEEAVDLKGNLYLFWKTDEVEERVPRFDEPGMADMARNAWKMVHARKLALDAAGKIKDDAAKSSRPLGEALAGQPELKIIRPAKFSWMTFGSVPFESPSEYPQSRLSTVDGVDAAGQDFMKAVFSLTAGQLDVAMDEPQTTAYVIRMVELTPDAKDLLKEFEESDIWNRYALMAFQDQQEIERAWNEEIKASAGFQWEKKVERRAVDYDD